MCSEKSPTRSRATIPKRRGKFCAYPSLVAVTEILGRSFAVAFDNDLGAAANHVPNGTLTAALIPYEYALLGTAHVETEVPKEAGATLKVETPPASNSTGLPQFPHVRKWTAPRPGGWARLKH